MFSGYYIVENEYTSNQIKSCFSKGQTISKQDLNMFEQELLQNKNYNFISNEDTNYFYEEFYTHGIFGEKIKVYSITLKKKNI